MDKSSTCDGCQQEGKWLFTYVELLVLSTVISISISVCCCVCVDVDLINGYDGTFFRYPLPGPGTRT
jgi:hypothetical protein